MGQVSHSPSPCLERGNETDPWDQVTLSGEIRTFLLIRQVGPKQLVRKTVTSLVPKLMEEVTYSYQERKKSVFYSNMYKQLCFFRHSEWTTVTPRRLGECGGQ